MLTTLNTKPRIVNVKVSTVATANGIKLTLTVGTNKS